MRLDSLPQLVDNLRVSPFSDALFFIRPPEKVLRLNDPGSRSWHRRKRLTHWKRLHTANIRIAPSGASIVTRTLSGQPASRCFSTIKDSRTNLSDANPASRPRTSGLRQLRQHNHPEFGSESKCPCNAHNADNKLPSPFILRRDAPFIVVRASLQVRLRRRKHRLLSTRLNSHSPRD